MGDDGSPLGDNLKETDSRGKKYAYSLVHMGGLRPFGRECFAPDGISGYGGGEEIQFFPATGTPTLAQYLVFQVYRDRVVFYIRNTGTREGYHRAEKLREYTVYFAS